MNEIIEALADAVKEKMRDKESLVNVPIQYELWNIAQVAAYFQRSEQAIRPYLALPSFPRAIRLPAIKYSRSHALYVAKDVIEWGLSHQE